MDGSAMIDDVEPVTNMVTVTIDRDTLAAEGA
jgi:hypothetical protein